MTFSDSGEQTEYPDIRNKSRRSCSFVCDVLVGSLAVLSVSSMPRSVLLSRACLVQTRRTQLTHQVHWPMDALSLAIPTCTRWLTLLAVPAGQCSVRPNARPAAMPAEGRQPERQGSLWGLHVRCRLLRGQHDRTPCPSLLHDYHMLMARKPLLSSTGPTPCAEPPDANACAAGELSISLCWCMGPWIMRLGAVRAWRMKTVSSRASALPLPSEVESSTYVHGLFPPACPAP